MSVLPFDGLGSPSYDKVLSVARLIVACVAIVVAPHCSGQESQPSESGTDTKSQSIDELLLFFPTKFPSGDWNPKDLQFTDVFFFAQDKTNLMRWRELQEERPHSHCVHVVHGDWGEVTHAMTKLYGCCFAALNMANAFVPGGAYVEGARAQEENMFRRTDCHFYVGPDEYNNTSDQYHSHMTSLLSAENGRVYLDSQHPRVCIRGPEDRSRSDLGYAWLPDEEVFPFYELRAAGQDLRNGSVFSESNARKRIAA